MKNLSLEDIKQRKRGVRRRRSHFKKIHKTNGVLYWLVDKGIKEEADRHKIVRYYGATVLNLNVKKLGALCVIIQNDFLKFTNWYNVLEQKIKNERSN